MKNETNTYDKLCDLIECCVKPVAPTVIQNCKEILFFATHEARFCECLKLIGDSESEFIIVTQTDMKEEIENLCPKCRDVILWSGKYNLEVLKIINNVKKLKEIDGFLFSTYQSIDLRDKNFYQIGEALKRENSNIHIFSSDARQDFYEYSDIQLFNQAIRTYEEIAHLVKMKLSCEKEKTV